MSENFDFGGEIVWRPDAQTIERAHLTVFMRQYGLKNFADLLQRSIQDFAWFTDAVLHYLDIQFYRPYSSVVDMSKGTAWPRWCVDGQMNIVHNLLDKYIGTSKANNIALVAENETGEVRRLTYAELSSEVNRMANGLRSLGLGKGDAIGILMPMNADIVVALLAIAKIGGIILPLFSGFGAGAVVSRLADAKAKALFTADGFSRRGKVIPLKPIADEAAAQLPSLQHMIIARYTGAEMHMVPGRDHDWHNLVSKQPDNAATAITEAEDPLMVIYTSGTTGKPKGALHTHCGFPIKAAQDMAFNMDLHPEEAIFWVTDMGWMMGPWLVFGSLLLGGTCVLYDGAPDYPSPDRLWKMAESHHLAVMGISPTLVRALIAHGDDALNRYNLSKLHCFASTGEPWNPDPWMWLFDKVGQRKIPIVNYSGGTEISGGIVCGNPLLPLKPCAFSAPCPGIAADVVDENGQSVRNQVGELVIRAPWIGMTRGFWNDPQRYLDTYWSRWPDVWVHGDFAAVDADGLWYILGRSDDTIKIAGKRLGPAEVESILAAHPSILESAAIGIPDPIKGSDLVVFVVLMPGLRPSETLRFELRSLIVKSLGKALAPQAVWFVADLPKTRNAKVMRRIIRSAYLGLDEGDTSSLVNPEAVAAIRHAA